MPLRSPKFGLTAVFRGPRLAGWNKSIAGETRWIASARAAPTPEAADEFYRVRFAELWDGSPPPTSPAPPPSGALTVATLGDRFKERKRRAGLRDKSLAEAEEIIDAFAEEVGGDRPVAELRPDLFGMVRASWAARFGPHRLYKFVSGVREMFKWAAGKGRQGIAAPDFGDEFELPTKAAFRRRKKERREAVGLLEFTRAEIRAQLAAASPSLLAMILLGLNCGFGNTDVSELPWSVVDLRRRSIDYARGKTYVDRRAVLWPETVASLRKLPKRKPAREEWLGRVFLTRFGYPYVRGKKDQVGMQYLALLRRLAQYRQGRNFYSLRRTFRTLADAVDSRAADLMMGHATDADMGGVYVQRIDDARLHAISRSVRSAILGASSAGRRRKAPSKGKGKKKAGRSPSSVAASRPQKPRMRRS
jgi:integrase